MSPEVARNAGASRFEISVDGRLAGFAEYRERPGKIVFTHTEVSDDFEGQGLGSLLVREALDQVRSDGLAVLPLCPFVARYIERHPEYRDLVDDSPSDHAVPVG